MNQTAVVVVDMLNGYQHPDAEQLAGNVAEIIPALADLIGQATDRDDVDVVYVNDNYGDFTADFSDIARSALAGAHPELVEPILPASGAYTVTKVRHSIFYASPVEYLLNRLGTGRLVLAGQVTEQCILYSALDAYIRHLPVVIPTDAVAHIDLELGAAALQMMRRNMKSTLVASADCLSL